MSSPQSYLTRWVVKKVIAPMLDADNSIEFQRKYMDRLSGIAPLPLGTHGRTLKIRHIPALWIDTGARNARTLLFLHGGAFNIGSIKSHREFAARLGVASKANVLLIDYRLAPEHPYPAGLEDAVRAYRWLLMKGYLPENITIVGDSAGGGLTLATAMKLRDEGVPLPAALGLISPWADLTHSGESIRNNASKDIMLNADWSRQMAHNYAGPDKLADPLVSPCYGEFKGLPPMMIHVGADELLLSDAECIAGKARAAGVEASLEVWRDVWHIWHIHAAYLPEAKKAMKKLGEFIQAHAKA